MYQRMLYVDSLPYITVSAVSCVSDVHSIPPATSFLDYHIRKGHVGIAKMRGGHAWAAYPRQQWLVQKGIRVRLVLRPMRERPLIKLLLLNIEHVFQIMFSMRIGMKSSGA